jgi:hypothetical protein
MFRSRFAEAFNKNVPSLGPQDIEDGVVSEEPSEQVELFLCALLGLVLNRKKYVEYGSPGAYIMEAMLLHRIYADIPLLQTWTSWTSIRRVRINTKVTMAHKLEWRQPIIWRPHVLQPYTIRKSTSLDPSGRYHAKTVIDQYAKDSHDMVSQQFRGNHEHNQGLV